MIQYLSENINAYINIANRKINAAKLLDYANDIIDNKIKNKKEAEKIYLDNLNHDGELFYKLKNTGRNYERWFNIHDELKDVPFGKFKTKQDVLLEEDEKRDVATRRKEEVRKSVIKTISKLADKEEPIDITKLETGEEAEKRIKGTGLKMMTPNQVTARLPILLAQRQAGNNSQKLNNEIRQII